MEMTDLILTELKDHVMREFGLTSDYTLISFKASNMSVTLRNENHEISVKVTGMALHEITKRINLKRQEFACESDLIQDIEEDNLDELDDLESVEELESPKKFKKAN